MADTELVIGKGYYYLSAGDFDSLVSALADAGYALSNFTYFSVTQDGYAGYYFEISSIDDGDGEFGGPEWCYLAEYDSFGYVQVWTSVQAHAGG